jgi:hypothetical protein
MTINETHIITRRDTAAWLSGDSELPGGMDVLRSPAFRRYLLAIVREVLRQEACSMIPVPVAAFAWERENQWGHNFQVEVQYTPRWRAIYAGRITREGIDRVTCYMN